MPISIERAKKHVSDWVKNLERFSTSQWPPHLFHTAQIEVAVEIIKTKAIICRYNQTSLICDVANQGALGNNVEAHKYARLYFRPRNGFHLKTEGIKSIEDQHRVDPHMSIPVAFLFDAIGVLSQENSYFTRGNFAKNDVAALTGDSDFDTLDFGQIYHDSDPGSKGAEIRNMRMSEVVVPQQLPLTYLKGVACRTIHEARMLAHLLSQAGLISPQICVEQRGSVFFKKAIFLVDIYTNNNSLHLRFHAPVSYAKPKYCVNVQVCEASATYDIGKWELEASKLWSFSHAARSASAIWTVWIEGCIAFVGPVPSQTRLIV